MNIIIPMGGKGQRFIDAGYTIPKSFIKFNGKPMFQHAIENLGIDGHYIYIVQKEHVDLLETYAPHFTPDYDLHILNERVDGSAAACLLAARLLDPNEPLLTANCDQIMYGWNPMEFLAYTRYGECDGIIPTFNSNLDICSYAKTMSNTFSIQEVAEKIVISNHATCGIYYFKHTRFFIYATEEMIRKNIRTNGEFYMCPVYNELIQIGKDIKIYPVQDMRIIGTPELFQEYLSENSITS
jgi:dTDP-glucose pyrophosphorylase